MLSYSPLLNLLKTKNINKYELVDMKIMSSATLAKISKGEYISLKIIDDLCNYLDCDIQEIIEHIKS
ncbi:DNA-binding Xre family transcriptional regulator [Acetoanaerobium pronyense]|uniref:DNA-binding Xre family transcriptional regulator n=1 Tax=Acetoanaerobium pronyense TaxID=1482736 RepID=A0ABS4KK99_9FIRM|nr:helix-turn-helix transcriptional regulator [Acetoanaerobium pronyense]MBP2028211.1 DNA-binding Xre family transcriptional regulator [Acetoanaerobium pronyense]